jgi:hypothetical protein
MVKQVSDQLPVQIRIKPHDISAGYITASDSVPVIVSEYLYTHI